MEEIKNIAHQSTGRRRRIRTLCQKHSERQCNGIYYQGDEGEWLGVDATLGRRREKYIRTRLKDMMRTNTLPSFVTYSGDPRGFVLYFDGKKLTQKEKELCNSLGLATDWGGNYSILTNKELRE